MDFKAEAKKIYQRLEFGSSVNSRIRESEVAEIEKALKDAFEAGQKQNHAARE